MSSSLAPGDYEVPGLADPGLQGEAGHRVSSLARHHARLQGARLPAHQHAIPLGTKRGRPALSPWLGTKRVLAFVITLAALSLIVLVTLSARESSSELTSAIDPALQPRFDAVWERADLAVLLGEARRGWTWGPPPISTAREP